MVAKIFTNVARVKMFVPSEMKNYIKLSISTYLVLIARNPNNSTLNEVPCVGDDSRASSMSSTKEEYSL